MAGRDFPKKRNRFSEGNANQPQPRKKPRMQSQDYQQFTNAPWQQGQGPLMPQPMTQGFQPQYAFYNQQPVQPSAPRRSQKSKNTVPEGLQRFIVSAFNKWQNDIDRDIMEQMLKGIIDEKKQMMTYYDENWDAVPVPRLPHEALAPIPKKIVQEPVQALRKRKQNRNRTPLPTAGLSRNEDDDEADSQWKVVGTSTSFEKQYLRLTAAPDPAKVRPEPILRQALEYFKERWKKDEIDYLYLLEQLRSIRQDMTVQHIQNKFTSEVYAINARLALQAEDLGQFNQCASRLEYLFQRGVKSRQREFTAYRIIYFTLQCFYVQLEKAMKNLSPKIKSSEEVKHALSFRNAVISENYIQMFQLRDSAPNLGDSLIDIFLPKLRMLYLLKIVKTYFPKISVSHLQKLLNFETVEEWSAFVTENGGVMDGDFLQCKESADPLSESKLLSKRV